MVTKPFHKLQTFDSLRGCSNHTRVPCVQVKGQDDNHDGKFDSITVQIGATDATSVTMTNLLLEFSYKIEVCSPPSTQQGSARHATHPKLTAGFMGSSLVCRQR